MRRTSLLTFLAIAVAATAVQAQTPVVVEYYHTDALGSVRAVTNAQGQVVRRHDFMPFGEEVNQPIPPGERHLYTGKERDHETGLDYFGARYYRAGVGRFTTIDPVHTWKDNLVDPQRWNRYAYVRNNPLRYVDPDGRQSRLVMPMPPRLGDDALLRNAAIRAEILAAQTGNGITRLGAEVVDALVLSTLLPSTRGERDAVLTASVLGVATPLQIPAGGLRALAFATEERLADHFSRHGAEFGARSAAEYLSGAQRLVEAGMRGVRGIETAVRANGDRLFYNSTSNEFAVVTRKGVLRTYFKPNEGYAYWRSLVK